MTLENPMLAEVSHGLPVKTGNSGAVQSASHTAVRSSVLVANKIPIDVRMNNPEAAAPARPENPPSQANPQDDDVLSMDRYFHNAESDPVKHLIEGANLFRVNTAPVMQAYTANTFLSHLLEDTRLSTLAPDDPSIRSLLKAGVEAYARTSP
jgi:hypothetical protein